MLGVVAGVMAPVAAGVLIPCRRNSNKHWARRSMVSRSSIETVLVRVGSDSGDACGSVEFGVLSTSGAVVVVVVVATMQMLSELPVLDRASMGVAGVRTSAAGERQASVCGCCLSCCCWSAVRLISFCCCCLSSSRISLRLFTGIDKEK